jgi:small-conductance mechanosensitive channel
MHLRAAAWASRSGRCRLEGKHTPSKMKVRQGLTGIGLLALVAAAAVGMYLTSRPMSPGPATGAYPPGSDESLSLDPRYLKTALRLAARAQTPGERSAAIDALSAADRELDLQYAYVLQRAAAAPLPATPQIHALRKRIASITSAIEARQSEVDRLKAQALQLHGARRSALEQRLDVRQADLGLLNEALDDANDALDQAGGRLQARLAELKAEHVALSEEHDAFKFPAYTGERTSDSLLRRWSRWQALGRMQSRVHQARQAAYADALTLTGRQSLLRKRIATEEAQGRAWWNNELTPGQIAKLPSSLTALIQRISSNRTMLRILSDRIRDMKALGSSYARWDTLADGAGRAALHSLVASWLWIVITMASAFFLNRLTEHLFARISLERRQKATLQAVLRISVQLAAVVVILMIVFGKPRDLSTVLGLAGAGLAIALRDFILSFLGWFVLMGRHGIRVGDFVEINQNSLNGVRGEVIEITPFRTVLLETGNWNEPGHVTGRKVAFMNMYAVSGYYFNFSTSGQWLWDELQVAIPRNETPYAVADKIRAIVAAATEPQTQQAESEWESVSTRYGTRSFSAQPAVNIRSTESGVVAVIRYITRADERPAMRNRLTHEVIGLLRNAQDVDAGVEILLAAEAAGHRPSR